MIINSLVATGRRWTLYFAACGALLSSASIALSDESPSTSVGATAAQIKAVLGLRGATNIGTDLVFKLGAMQSRNDAEGVMLTQGAELAIAQIKAMGGPTIDLITKEGDYSNPTATAGALAELADDGASAVLTSGVAVDSGVITALVEHKILDLDSGGIAIERRGKPYFWITRALQPTDDFAGALEYWKKTSPQIKRIALVDSAQGVVDVSVVADFTEALAEAGFSLASNEIASNSGDYSTAISHLLASHPDAVFLAATGVGTGRFMRQYVAAGLTAPVIGTEYDAQSAEIGGAVFSRFAFSADWFDASNPTNGWAKLFVDSYRARFGASPDVSAANAYEDTFALWSLIRRVLAKGGDVGSGEQLQRELMANRSVKSLYGGDETELDDLMFDAATHTVIERPFGVYTVLAGQPHQVAAFDFGGANFKLLN